ncbi:hypothetical protein [Ectothiorhodospira marina]|uniref:Uncharacterized protein n=1 Tax=Ectothiorhodospira marina TaxID=1396821 RepID=A0A1H7LZZ3_9GAMM|nr:hypothetical protein [Ectothiorhodospira marina]SEL04543.1 hypothetical protein SAMN05444515_10894 [Ectothiorhodospira marina]
MTYKGGSRKFSGLKSDGPKAWLRFASDAHSVTRKPFVHGATKTFFTKVKEELHFIPAQLKVLEYWQEKAVFEQDGEERIVALPGPGKAVLEGGQPLQQFLGVGQ